MLLRFAFLVALFTIPSACIAADWAQFLGPQRNGISKEENLIDRFSVDGPNIRWRTDLGVGMSGIVVTDKTACTLYQDDQQQYVVAVDVLTGDVKWKTAIAPNYKNGMGDGPRSTPAIDQGQLFALSGEGVLACLSFPKGEKVWSVDPFKEFGGKPSEYGMSCSPILTDEHAIVTVGASKATVAAFDRKTGELAWTAGNGNPAGYSSPALLKVKQTVQLVVFHGSGAMGLVPKTGKEIWSYPYITDYNCNIATPISVGDNVLLSAGENHGTVLLSVPEKAGGKISEIWKSFGNRSDFRNEWQTSILLNEFLFGFDNVGSAGPVTNLTCLNAKDGTVMWQKRRFGKGNMIAADRKFWCTTMDGDLVIVNATIKNYEELDRATVMGQTRQAPTLSDGKLYLRDGAEMICIDIRKNSN
ncbi:PQQ-binding-like beta-propeller repeat protein [bacterium]|nr:PQQ-binding-like beta-propeller repeat protein [bacterium]